MGAGVSMVVSKHARVGGSRRDLLGRGGRPRLGIGRSLGLLGLLGRLEHAWERSLPRAKTWIRREGSMLADRGGQRRRGGGRRETGPGGLLT